FVWDNGFNTFGNTTSTTTGLAMGNYAVTVTETITGCSATDSIDVFPSPTAPVVYVQSLTPTCSGFSDGSVTVNTSGGIAVYTYVWSDGPVGASRLGMAAGSYTVTVTDGAGCSSTLTFDIPENESPDASVTANGPICSGDSAVFTLVGHDGATVIYNYGGLDSTIVLTSDTVIITVLNVTATLTMTLVSIDDGTCFTTLATGATVVVLPVPGVVITNNGPICNGADAIFTLTGTVDAIVTYSLGGGPLLSTTLTGGVSTITIPAATVDQTIALDSIFDGACPVSLVAFDTIVVNPVIALTVNDAVCENTNYIYPDGFAEVIIANSSHISNLLTALGCDSIITTNVAMNPVYNIVDNINACENSVVIYPDGTNETITASTSNTSNLLTFRGCDSIIVTNVTMFPVYSIPENIALCSGEDYTYPDGTIHVDITANESYTSSFLTVNGCDSIIITSIAIIPLPIVSAGADVTVCQGTDVTLTATNPSGAAIAWDNGILDGVPFTPVATQTYTVTATSAFGCISTDDVTVTYNPNPVANFSANILQGCAPLEVIFTNLSTGSPVQCNWDFGDGNTGVGCNEVTHTYDISGLQTVTLSIVDANGCTSVATYADYISIFLQPTASFTSSGLELDILDTEVTFENTSTNATSYVWDFGDETGNSTVVNPTHVYDNTGFGSYVVMLIAQNSLCADTAYQTFIVNDVLIYYVPNTFTPDNDQHNQTFRPIFSSGYDPYDYHLIIFNRWGETIFESFDSAFGWDGTYGGKIMQDGVYTWKLDFQETMTDKRHSASGHVNILR
ncbi:MAG: gliding motility-associated-like protein, partial [Crocinitomicaceae bacterium]